jgi:HAD superfamily hydrolase (TIGR01509 family)
MARRFDAVIFDMDGVIADSEPAHENAFNAVLNPLGHAVVPELQQEFMGHGLDESWAKLKERFNLADSIETLLERYEDALLVAFAEVHETLPGVREVIDAVRQRHLPLAVASSSDRLWVEALLTGVGLIDAFDVLVSGREVTNGKPAPDIYLLAASKLGVAPHGCLAIEDTPAGVASVKAAGMFAVQTRSASSAFPPIEGADLVLGSLLEFELGLLDENPGT